jgi:hypothetical protein
MGVGVEGALDEDLIEQGAEQFTGQGLPVSAQPV